MARKRVFLFLISLVVIGITGTLATYYARGYRFNLKSFKFQPNGILVLKSEPDGASVYINSELRAATNSNLSIAPGVYDVEVKKDGYTDWKKRLTVEKEVVTQATISLFKTMPSLSPVTLAGTVNPVMSQDGSKIIYSVLPAKNLESDKIGLWEMDTYNLPLGFNNSPKRITDGDLTGATYTFSPDGRQILLNVSNAIFLIDTGTFTGQNQRINIASQKAAILSEWKIEKDNMNQNLIKNLPQELFDVLTRKTSAFVFSADNNMILYTASSSATLSGNLIKSLPGSSTQTQERNLQAGHTYVYDIKEDRNFPLTDQPVTIDNNDNTNLPSLRWMSTSKHLLLAAPEQIVIMDYDGTNRQTVYSGSYLAPFAFPFANTTKLLILTNLGSSNSASNLYTLTVK